MFYGMSVNTVFLGGRRLGVQLLVGVYPRRWRGQLIANRCVWLSTFVSLSGH